MISKQIKTKSGQKSWTTDAIQRLAEDITAGDRRALSQGITLVESQLERDRPFARQLLSTIKIPSDQAPCLAITGPPGAGKSSFIETIGLVAIAEGHQIAVLSIDPSSELTSGSILGDKTRMAGLALSEHAYIRPSPSSGMLGGVSPRTWEVKQLCLAAGYNYIFIETVGVGQSESEVRHLSDMVVVLVQPGAGDDIQGIKMGLNEVADFFVVNKADGDQAVLARDTKSAILSSSRLFRNKIDPSFIVLHSNQKMELTKACWDKMKERFHQLITSGRVEEIRSQQLNHWFTKKTKESLFRLIEHQEAFQKAAEIYLKQVDSGEMNVHVAIDQLLAAVSVQIKPEK